MRSTRLATAKANTPATILIHLIHGLHRYTIFGEVAERGPGSNQNILSTPWCCTWIDTFLI